MDGNNKSRQVFHAAVGQVAGGNIINIQEYRCPAVIDTVQIAVPHIAKPVVESFLQSSNISVEEFERAWTLGYLTFEDGQLHAFSASRLRKGANSLFCLGAFFFAFAFTILWSIKSLSNGQPLQVICAGALVLVLFFACYSFFNLAEELSKQCSIVYRAERAVKGFYS